MSDWRASVDVLRLVAAMGIGLLLSELGHGVGGALGAGVGIGSVSAQCLVPAETLVEFNRGARRSTLRGIVRASVGWDPDGDGPEPEWLVIAGNFDRVNGVPAENVAAWDGTRWRSFGVDFVLSSDVHALAVHQGRLILGGDFDFVRSVGESEIIGARGLIELTPDGWRLFENRPGPGLGPFRYVQALLSDGESLFIASERLSADDDTTSSSPIVRWDGEMYRTAKLPAPTTGGIWAMAFHAGELHVAGSFVSGSGGLISRVARYDGVSWHALGSGLAFEGKSIVSAGGALHVGVVPTSSSGPSVYRWNGAEWSGAGSGLGGATALSLAALDGDVVVGTGLGTPYINVPMDVFRLSDGVWKALEGHLSPVLRHATYSLSFHRGDLIAAGEQMMATTTRAVGGVARWTGRMWTSADDGLNGTVRSLLPDGDGIIACGSFTSIGGVSSPGIARITASGVEAIPCPIVFADNNRETVRRMTMLGDRLVITGAFMMQNESRDGIAIREASGEWVVPRYDSAWLKGLRLGTVDNVLYVLGQNENGVSLHRLDEDVLTRVTGITSVTGSYELCEHDGELILTGASTTGDSDPVALISAFDGSVWRELGAGLSGGVGSAVSYRGQLIAAGNFTINETGEGATLARWDGSNWTRMEPPFTGYLRIRGGDETGIAVFLSNQRAAVLHGGRWVEVTGLFSQRDDSVEDYSFARLGSRCVMLGTVDIGEAARVFGLPMTFDLPCEADLNCDGDADIVDLLDYFQAYADCHSGEAGCDAIRADFDQNGVFDIMDVLAFLDALGAGCE
ncbi:MAG: hypothetical protein KF838_12730 [Phycisphaeraceae bacterium]|nr:MAG: hypothetical protein KF838_12730 [Phycisphaeraceae bacterium]